MKIGCWECQNQLTPPYFDQVSERHQLLSAKQLKKTTLYVVLSRWLGVVRRWRARVSPWLSSWAPTIGERQHLKLHGIFSGKWVSRIFFKNAGMAKAKVRSPALPPYLLPMPLLWGRMQGLFERPNFIGFCILVILCFMKTKFI